MLTAGPARDTLRRWGPRHELPQAEGLTLMPHDMSRTAEWSPADECCERLQQAGWFVSDVLVKTPDGPAWIVTGTDGAITLRAIGQTQVEAWLHAWEQAEAAGALAL